MTNKPPDPSEPPEPTPAPDETPAPDYDIPRFADGTPVYHSEDVGPNPIIAPRHLRAFLNTQRRANILQQILDEMKRTAMAVAAPVLGFVKRRFTARRKAAFTQFIADLQAADHNAPVLKLCKRFDQSPDKPQIPKKYKPRDGSELLEHAYHESTEKRKKVLDAFKNARRDRRRGSN